MKAEKRSCVDCLHCKVSAKSTKKCWLCFCSVKKNRVNHKIAFFTDRKVCKQFYDMGA